MAGQRREGGELAPQPSVIDQFIAVLERPLSASFQAKQRSDEAKRLLRRINADNVNIPSLSNKLALLVAAAKGDGFFVEELLDKGANINIAERGTGDTALHKAAAAGKVGMVNLLLEKGADRNKANSEGRLAEIAGPALAAAPLPSVEEWLSSSSSFLPSLGEGKKQPVEKKGKQEVFEESVSLGAYQKG